MNISKILKTPQIPIYQHELAVAGLAEKIQQQNSIAYLVPIIYEPVDFIGKAIAETIKKLCLASEHDNDLYTTKSILVTTNWNKNDDVFDAKEVWASRYTPSHKPTNIGHDEHKICGHVTDVWAIAEDGSIIPSNTNIDELPSLYHLVNAAVIYQNWQDEELVKRTESLIAEIKEGKKFVSMECLFTNFDYATIKIDTNETKIIARAEESSWMTKHLRAYGGSGEYEGYKVGRLLRNITFCGKGYVDKPANPNSIIFATLNINNEKSVVLENSVYNNINDTSKGDKMNLDELKIQNEGLVAKIKELETSKSEIEAALAQSKLELSSANDIAKAKDDEITSVKAKIDELVKANTELTEQINKAKAAELKANRVTKLVDGGIAKDNAEKKVELFAYLSDEQFNVIADELISATKAILEAAKPKVETEGKCDDKMDDKDEDEKDSKGEEAVDTVEAPIETPIETVVDPNLTIGSDTVTDKELDAVRNELAEAIASVLIVKKSKVKK